MNSSPLVNYTKISPYKNSPRQDAIRKITIHHMAGDLSIENCGDIFQNSRASANYGIGSDGRIGMYVKERDRSWASDSPTNDHQAVTIEVANDRGDPSWHVSDTALSKLIDLCVDICRRNGINKLNYTGDTSGNLTRHNMFAATGCPGNYLQGKLPYIAEQVNEKLGDVGNHQPQSTATAVHYQACEGYRWLPEVEGLKDYAGNLGQPISGVRIKASTGDIYYRTRTFNGYWLREIKNSNSNDNNPNSYSGIFGSKLDAIQIRTPVREVCYRVHNVGYAKDDWCKWITSKDYYGDTKDTQVYAGNFGIAIDGLQVEFTCNI